MQVCLKTWAFCKRKKNRIWALNKHFILLPSKKETFFKKYIWVPQNWEKGHFQSQNRGIPVDQKWNRGTTVDPQKYVRQRIKIGSADQNFGCKFRNLVGCDDVFSRKINFNTEINVPGKKLGGKIQGKCTSIKKQWGTQTRNTYELTQQLVFTEIVFEGIESLGPIASFQSMQKRSSAHFSPRIICSGLKHSE